jgi:DnaK suppressor protein
MTSTGEQRVLSSLALQYSALESASIVRERLDDRLNAIEAALHRLEEGTYGRCEGCGQEISLERLEADPAARLCADCAAHAADSM